MCRCMCMWCIEYSKERGEEPEDVLRIQQGASSHIAYETDKKEEQDI